MVCKIKCSLSNASQPITRLLRLHTLAAEAVGHLRSNHFNVHLWCLVSDRGLVDFFQIVFAALLISTFPHGSEKS